MPEIPGLATRLQDIPDHTRSEIPEAFERAVRAGANSPLDYVGSGMYGIVFCDQGGIAWKVMRSGSNERSGITDEMGREFQLENLAQEYEWLRDAADTPIAKHVARVYDIHPQELVLERECVDGRPGAWADDRKLHALHTKIEKAMLKVGWTAPEFKENSYIIRPDGTEVLVDTSMAQRIGMNLAGWVEDILDGRRKTRERWRDLAFYLLRERREKTVPEQVVQKLMARLVDKDPEIERAFSLKGPSLGSKKTRDDFERFHSRLLERRLIKHQYAKNLIDSQAVAVCLHKPETEHQRERWYAVTPGFPYDEGAWRVSVWDKHGPSTHYSSAMHHGPFMTILQAVDDVLFEERRARVVEYILPSGEHVRVGKGPSCF